MTLTVVILTYNEELHINRALDFVSEIADRILVIDSGSTDKTIAIAKAAGADVLEHQFVTQSQQFNWALQQLPADTEWVLRLDADEVVTEQLAREISAKLSGLRSEITGVYIPRRMTFLGRTIKWGGIFPVKVLRLFRNGKGRCEDRWMDEHIIVDGETSEFSHEMIDDNLNSLTWWTEKHNSYSSREVVDLLNMEYGFAQQQTVADLRNVQQVGVKRWLKENIYARLPGGFRAFAYFVYRYILRLGFLDGKEGTAFHVLQGFWYRYLVDMKLHEVKKYMRRSGSDVRTAIRNVLGIEVSGGNRPDS